ncbi:MAG: hypothetical protein CV089_21585 [Nitrospira sp. WS110]|nr:hypothetical protein [Nitrospira sp. WS110]
MKKLPQTIGNEVVEQLNDLIGKSDRFRDWDSREIQVLRHRIRELQKVDARDAFVRFGALAALCGRVDDVREYLRKALTLPDHESTKHEFWASYCNVGLYREAQELGAWLLDPRRGFFTTLWNGCISIGLVRTVAAVHSDAMRLYREELAHCDFSVLEEAATVMQERDLHDGDVGAALELAGEVQRAHKIMFTGELATSVKVIRPPEDLPYLYFAVQLDAPIEEIHAMNRELARLIAEKMGAYPSGLVVSFAKALPVEMRAAA